MRCCCSRWSLRWARWRGCICLGSAARTPSIRPGAGRRSSGRRWRARREPGAQFLLAWLVPSWIVFELVLTKLPHYVLPLFPAIAILSVGALERRVLSRSWLRRGSAWWFAIPALASVTAVVGAIAL